MTINTPKLVHKADSGQLRTSNEQRKHVHRIKEK